MSYEICDQFDTENDDMLIIYIENMSDTIFWVFLFSKTFWNSIFININIDSDIIIDVSYEFCELNNKLN